MRVNKYSVYKTSISLFIDFNRYQTSNLFTNLCTLCEVLYFAAFLDHSSYLFGEYCLVQ